MKMCPIRCTYTHNEKDNFCWKCGGKLEEKNCVCVCGKVLGAVDIFCPECGERKGGR